MYRCSECHKEYEVRPEYCDCGNDIFEEVEAPSYNSYVENDDYYEEPVRPVRRKRTISQEELEEIAAEKADRTKALITIGVSLVISIVLLCLPPYPAKKVSKVEKSNVERVKLPQVGAFWDDSLPASFRKDDPNSHLPLLNRYFGSISNDLRTYLVNIGAEYSAAWNPNVVDGSGEARIQFTINRDGIIDNKKMILKSRNETLDNSVLLLLSTVTNLDAPPEDYKGERIILAFRVSPKTGSKVYYPTAIGKSKTKSLK